MVSEKSAANAVTRVLEVSGRWNGLSWGTTRKGPDEKPGQAPPMEGIQEPKWKFRYIVGDGNVCCCRSTVPRRGGCMRYLLLGALLVVSTAVFGLAASSSALPYQFGSGSPPSTLTLGGVTGTLTWNGSNWTMTVGGQTFATGTFSGGTFTVTSLLGSSCSPCTSTTGLLSLGQFPTHGGWVSAVADWANSNLSGQMIGQVVSQAAKIEGPLASGDPKHGGGHGRP